MERTKDAIPNSRLSRPPSDYALDGPGIGLGCHRDFAREVCRKTAASFVRLCLHGENNFTMRKINFCESSDRCPICPMVVDCRLFLCLPFDRLAE